VNFLNKQNIISKIEKLLINFETRKILSLKNECKKRIIEIILKKKILFFISEKEINYDLGKLKNILIKIDQSENITKKILKRLSEECSKIIEELDFQLKKKVEEIINLIKSWKKINSTFDEKEISNKNLDNLINDFERYLTFKNLINQKNQIAHQELNQVLIQIEENIKSLLEKKSNFFHKIKSYLNEFSNKEFIFKLVNGQSFLLKDLSPDIYKQLYNSILKDKLMISLK